MPSQSLLDDFGGQRHLRSFSFVVKQDRKREFSDLQSTSLVASIETATYPASLPALSDPHATPATLSGEQRLPGICSSSEEFCEGASLGSLVVDFEFC